MLLSSGRPIATTIDLADSSPMRNASYYAPTGLALTSQFAAYAALYRAQPWVYTLVRKLGTSAARLPLKVFERVSETDRVPARGSAYGDLMRNPNPRTGPKLLWLWVFSTVELYGEAMLLKFRDDNGRVRELQPMHPSNLVVRPGDDGLEYVHMATGSSVGVATFPAADVVHFRGYNPDNVMRGVSPCEPLRQTLLSEDAMRRATTALWKNGARPSVILSSPNTLSQGAIDRVSAQWDAAHGGVDSWGKTAVLEEGLTPHLQQLNSEELQYIEGRRLNREECCAAWDVPPPAVQILDRATFCLPAEALVYTTEGPRPIVDVRPGDYVWSRDDGGSWVRSRVAHSRRTGVDEVLTIRTTNRTLRCNGRHPILARRKHPAPVGGSGGYQCVEWADEWVKAADLLEGDTIVTLGQLPDVGGNQAPTRTVDVPFMEMAGLLVGDGNVTRSKGAAIGLAFARATAAPYMDRYRTAILSSFPGMRLQEQPRMTRFSSVAAGREMDLLGFGGLAHTKRVPGWVFVLTAELRLAFLRGFLDADGSVDKKGRASFSSCNSHLLAQFRHLCMGLGIPVTNQRTQEGITKLPNGRMIAFRQHAFTCSDPGANRRIGSHTPLYVERMAAAAPFGRKDRAYPYHGGVGFEAGACSLARIGSITREVIHQPVYDLEVEGTHNFVAEGVVVHNSNITEQMRSLYRETMAPRLEAHEDVLATQLAPDFTGQGELYAEWVMDDVLRGSFEARMAAKAQAIQTGQMMPSEGRAQENLPFVEGSDQLLVNAALIPLKVVEAVSPGTGDDVTVLPQKIKGLSALDARTVAGRLSRAATVAEVDASKVVAGLPDEAQTEVFGLVAAAVARQATVAELRLWVAGAVADPFEIDEESYEPQD